MSPTCTKSRFRAPNMNRRDWLRIGGLSFIGLSSTELARMRAEADPDSPAARHRGNSCVFIFLFGGPSHIDLWDMKPNAPKSIRGEFQPVSTNVPGIFLSEHLPRLTQQMDQLCLLRSMHHGDPVHGTACSQMITGRPHRRPGSTDTFAPDDWPSLSALAMRYGSATGHLPSSIVLPWYLMFPSQGRRIAGQTGALMGDRYNAFLVDEDPSRDDFKVPGLKPPAGVSLKRLRRREQLLRQIESAGLSVPSGSVPQLVAGNYRNAFSMLNEPGVSAAFDLQKENRSVRDRYGGHKFGQSLLLARPLIEAGTSLVAVNWDDPTRDEKQSPFWDTHHKNFERLKGHLAPPFDRAFSAFLQDLADRGLLESTLVCVVGEFGRSPKIGRIVQNGMTAITGRDHWPYAFTVLMAGGGVRGGQVYGASDKHGGFVKNNPVTPPDLAATILQHLGIDRHLEYHAPLLDQRYRISTGQPILDLG